MSDEGCSNGCGNGNGESRGLGSHVVLFRPKYMGTYRPSLEDDKAVSALHGDSEIHPMNASHCACCQYHQSRIHTGTGHAHKQEEEDSPGVCCDKDWKDFTEYTTLHGLRYIWHQDSTWTRRILWLALTLVCIAVMMYQIIDRAIYFYEWPVTVNVKINYNDTLAFPSLTFCNQNAFRATKAASMGHYQLISDLFHDHRDFYTSDLELYNATNLTFSDLYQEAGHSKEDIILSCDWRGETCGPENFTEIATDHGRCYTFNNVDSKRLFVDSPVYTKRFISNCDGVEFLQKILLYDHFHLVVIKRVQLAQLVDPWTVINNNYCAKEGLTMTLNIEQYEYMPGPNDAAGIKILLHHRHQFPNVRELGMVLSAGTHSLVGMKIVSIRNLPKPHGLCSSPKPKHFQEYAAETCIVECKATLLKTQCGCRLYHMPDFEDTPVCTLWQYFSCYKPNIARLRQRAKSSCTCPVPCQFDLFEPSVSYATSSPVVTGRFLAMANQSVLKTKYDAARDVTHRLRPEKRKAFTELTDNLEESVDRLQNLIISEIESKLHLQREALKKVNHDIDKIYNETAHLYAYQEYIVKKNFIRARDAMNERTFSNVAFGMQEFVFDVESSIRHLALNDVKYEVAKKVIFLEVIRQLDGRLDICKRAYQNYTEFFTALQTGAPIFNYQFKQEPTTDNDFIVPLPLFNRVLQYPRSIKSMRRLELALNRSMNELENYKVLANETFHTGFYNDTAIFWTSVNFLQQNRRYLQGRDEFLYELPNKIESLLADRAQELLRYKRSFDTVANNILIQLDGISRQAQALSSRQEFMKHGVFNDIVTGIRLAKEFLNGTASKKDVGKQFLTEEILHTKDLLKTFFQEVRSRGHEAYDEWTQMGNLAVSMWTMAIDDVNLHTYYKYKKKTDVLVNKTLKIQDLVTSFDSHRQHLDLRAEMHHVYSEFPEALAAMLKEMTQFKATGELNAQFLKDNILQMSIFYKELSYEQITQQRAYDIFALLCDVGGSMGLFVGASVISIFEILDLIGFTYVRRLRQGGR